MQGLRTVTDETFADTVLGGELPVVVDFWAEWCPPCRRIAASLAELAVEFEGRMLFTAINSDENPGATRRYSVMSLPTLLVFQGGELVGSIVGARPKAQLREFFAPHARTAPELVRGRP